MSPLHTPWVTPSPRGRAGLCRGAWRSHFPSCLDPQIPLSQTVLHGFPWLLLSPIAPPTPFSSPQLLMGPYELPRTPRGFPLFQWFPVTPPTPHISPVPHGFQHPPPPPHLHFAHPHRGQGSTPQTTGCTHGGGEQFPHAGVGKASHHPCPHTPIFRPRRVQRAPKSPVHPRTRVILQEWSEGIPKGTGCHHSPRYPEIVPVAKLW